MKFLADGMLGKLTRWLRILGHDVIYFNDADDDQLVKIALEEKRVLLTRDYQLSRRAATIGVEIFYVEGRTEPERLAELAHNFGVKLEIDIANSHCPKCNDRITPVPKEEIKHRIQESTSRFHSDFWICPSCKQIYWQGSHWKRIDMTLIQARYLMKSDNSQ